jgi:hypothetical protein
MVNRRFTLPILAALPLAGFCSVAHANVFERSQNGNLVETSQPAWQTDRSPAGGGRYTPKAQPGSDPSPSQNAVRQHIQATAARYGVDRSLVDAVAWQESRYNPRAISTAGNPHDVEQNVAGGTAYLRQQLERFGNNVPLALAAYNAGPGAVLKYGGIPPYRETQNYVRQIMRRLSATSADRTGY